MLVRLAIRNIVLIEKLDVELHSGLIALTGETGAGKSIILDSLGLALGKRASRNLLKNGAEQSSATATFELQRDHPVFDFLREQEIVLEEDELLILRRTLSGDNRSRAFINDQAVSLNLLKTAGSYLVEVHGQFEQQGLLDPQNHLSILDAFGRLQVDKDRCLQAFKIYKKTWQQFVDAKRELEAAREDQDYFQHVLAELEDLEPLEGEEDDLQQKRQELMAQEKLKQVLDDVASMIEGSDGVLAKLALAQRRLERAPEPVQAWLEAATAAVERASIEASEAAGEVHNASDGLDLSQDLLERTEERLFALRNLARKHKTSVDGLCGLLEEYRNKIGSLENKAKAISLSERLYQEQWQIYLGHARSLSAKRQKSAKELDQRVRRELEALKLGRMRFQTKIEPLDEEKAGQDGLERISFQIASNPGQPFGALGKIASGGELSRLMLALKVILAEGDTVQTMVFDEVDSGIGGAVADAVGQHLAELGTSKQVLVVTHAPQIAAGSDHHFAVRKVFKGGMTSVTLEALDKEQHRDEIARMLSGASVTKEAKAAAQSLIARKKNALFDKAGAA